jgi:hypothetical protein
MATTPLHPPTHSLAGTVTINEKTTVHCCPGSSMIKAIMDCYSDARKNSAFPSPSSNFSITNIQPKYLEDERGIKGTVPQNF